MGRGVGDGGCVGDGVISGGGVGALVGVWVCVYVGVWVYVWVGVWVCVYVEVGVGVRVGVGSSGNKTTITLLTPQPLSDLAPDPSAIAITWTRIAASTWSG